jgi:hypothetical protein
VVKFYTTKGALREILKASTMNWITIYITGSTGFQKNVEDELKKSDLQFIPGFSNELNVALYWLDDRIDLRVFKKAIGSKLVWKYRLHFYSSVEEFIESTNKYNSQLTNDEQALINKMNSMENER